jgi:hypothetical protein
MSARIGLFRVPSRLALKLSMEETGHPKIVPKVAAGVACEVKAIGSWTAQIWDGYRLIGV